MPKRGEKARKIKKLKSGGGVKPPKSWWDMIVSSLKGEHKYTKKQIPRIAGGLWAKKPKAAKIKIIKKYQV